jgi:anti-sigma B factor antagonist
VKTRKPNREVVALARRSSLELGVTHGDGATVIATVGQLDIATSEQLEQAAREALELGRGVVVDLSELSLCDSTGLGALVRLHRLAQSNGQEVRLRRPRAHVADLLAMTGIDKVIPVDTA